MAGGGAGVGHNLRMLLKIDDLCAERDRLKAEQGGPTKGRVLGGRSW
jgi:hypothetical protein